VERFSLFCSKMTGRRVVSYKAADIKKAALKSELAEVY
jgi:hypothetical protein